MLWWPNQVSDWGFAPIALGNIDAGGALPDRTGPLVLQNRVKLG